MGDSSNLGEMRACGDGNPTFEGERDTMFRETADRLVKEGWLTEGDAKRIKQGLNSSSN